MSLESDFYTVLNVVGVTALVGDRIAPSHEADGVVAPYVVYQPIFAEGKYDLDGDTGASRVRMQVDCYATDADAAAAIALVVIAAVPETGWPLHRTGHSNQDLGFEGPETRLYRRLVEFSIHHR